MGRSGNSEIQIAGPAIEGTVKAIAFSLAEKAIPFLVPGIALAVGLVQQLPWFQVIVGTTVTAAFTVHFLTKFDEWRFRTRVQDKLGFIGVLFTDDSKGGGKLLGIHFSNSATFPIDWRVTKIQTRLNTTIPMERHKVWTGTMPPQGTGWYYDMAIDIKNPSTGRVPDGFIVGSVEFEVEYGKKGNLKYKIQGKKQVVVQYNTLGVTNQFTWAEME